MSIIKQPDEPRFDYWWEDFFSGDWQDVQQAFKKPETTRSEVGFISNLLDLPQGSEVLDVPSGEGRLALELAQQGFKVTCVELTRGLIDKAREKAKRRGLKLEFFQCDMRNLPWKDRFDAAINYWGSFGYFDDDGNESFVRAIANSLKPNGKFLVETHTLETILPNDKPRDWRKVGDTFALEERTFNYETSRVDVQWTFLKANKISKSYSSIRIYSFHELCGLLNRAGFVHWQACETLTGKPFQLGAARLTIVATKSRQL